MISFLGRFDGAQKHVDKISHISRERERERVEKKIKHHVGFGETARINNIKNLNQDSR